MTGTQVAYPVLKWGPSDSRLSLAKEPQLRGEMLLTDMEGRRRSDVLLRSTAKKTAVLKDPSRCINQCHFPAHDISFKSKIDILSFPTCFLRICISVID